MLTINATPGAYQLLLYAELSGLRSRYTWAKGTRWYYYPVRISLQSVGPGAAPAAASFAIALDPNVVQDVRIGNARLNHKAHDAGVHLIATTRSSALFETRWRTSTTLKAGDRLDLEVEVTARKPAADLPTIKHP